MRMERLARCAATLFLILLSGLALGSEAPDDVVRVGVLRFGTVSWELNVVQHHHLDRAAGFTLDVHSFGSSNAAAVALQSGAVDVIVNDWIWVSRQRGKGRPWTFYPWSTTVGAVMVRPDAGIETVSDLAGHRLGIAGGPVDKSWLLLRAYYRQRYGEDLAELVDPAFAAPPLLNRLMLRGDLPAVINYWHYNARLAASGMRALISVEDMLPALGIDGSAPLLGWVFSEDWAQRHPQTVLGFLRASYAAKALLAHSDGEWERLRRFIHAEDDATLAALRDAFRAGIPGPFGQAQIAAARELFTVLAREGGETLTGGQTELAPGTFWIPPEEVAQWRP